MSAKIGPAADGFAGAHATGWHRGADPTAQARPSLPVRVQLLPALPGGAELLLVLLLLSMRFLLPAADAAVRARQHDRAQSGLWRSCCAVEPILSVSCPTKLPQMDVTTAAAAAAVNRVDK